MEEARKETSFLSGECRSSSYTGLPPPPPAEAEGEVPTLALLRAAFLVRARRWYTKEYSALVYRLRPMKGGGGSLCQEDQEGDILLSSPRPCLYSVAELWICYISLSPCLHPL